MNVLWLNAGLLLPLDKGGKLRTWHLMRHLARRHAITWLSFAEPDQSPADVNGMREVAERVVTVPRVDVSKGSIRFHADAARYLLHAEPYVVAKYRSREYAWKAAALLRDHRYDLVVCDFLPPIVNMPQVVPCPSVLFTHNVEAEIWRRHVETARNPVQRALLGGQWRRMLAFERRALERFGLVLTVSDADRATFERLYPAAARRYHVVPTGVDTEHFRVGGPGGGSPRHLVFTGSMDWLPNEDGMLYFCREILPLIRLQEPRVTVGIVGRAPTPAVLRLAEENGVEVTGRVDDVRPHVARAAVSIVPLRIGGGTRLKIFEAMSMGKAVVSTTVGAEGLPVTDGRDIILADEPAAFAAAVVRLMRNADERRRIEAAARQLVVARYDWSAVSRELEDALLSFAGRDRQPEAMQATA
ncbi:MAG TPA: glycosyltransferase [Vicinamibacterales bacterium]|nr:glycosyltransferase [Vicinamibacterales bacterium]